MAVEFKMDENGGFVAADHEQRIGGYAHPGTPRAEAAKENAAKAAARMIADQKAFAEAGMLNEGSLQKDYAEACRMLGKTAEIHGENAVSLAVILEYLVNPAHPYHDQAVARAERFIEAERKARIEASAASVRHAREHMTEEEWSRIVD